MQDKRYRWPGDFPASVVPGFYGELASLPTPENGLNRSRSVVGGRLFGVLRDYARLLSAEMERTKETRIQQHALKSLQLFPAAHGIPYWAIGLCAGLIFISLALLLVGNIITNWERDGPARTRNSSLPPQPLLKGANMSIRLANKRWEGEKTAEEPRGGQSFSRGAMMLRQFTRHSNQPSVPSPSTYFTQI